MRFFAIGIEHPDMAAVQCTHDAIRANIVGPLLSTTSIIASIAACHSGRAASFFGSAV